MKHAGKNEPLLFMFNGNILPLKSVILYFMIFLRLSSVEFHISMSTSIQRQYENATHLLQSCLCCNAALQGRLTARSRGRLSPGSACYRTDLMSQTEKGNCFLESVLLLRSFLFFSIIFSNNKFSETQCYSCLRFRKFIVRKYNGKE